MAFSLRAEKIVKNGGALMGGRLPRVIAVAAVLSACVAAPFPHSVRAAVDAPGLTYLGSTTPCRPSVFLARQGDAGVAETAAEKETGKSGQNGSGTDSETAPAASESEDLEKFTPSEEIEADQGVDFPYDI